MTDTPASATQALDPRRDRLREIIEEKSLITGRTFTLASGRTSTFFVNLKQTMLDPEGANLLSDMVLDVMEEQGIHNIGGLEMGAVPLVSAVCTKSFERFPVNAFFVRKNVKDHGAEKVVTTGGSAVQAAEAVRARGCHVSKILAIVDREEGGRENLVAQGFELISLLKRSDFPGIDG
jgi:orotate phosphoribosyltransferase